MNTIRVVNKCLYSVHNHMGLPFIVYIVNSLGWLYDRYSVYEQGVCGNS